MKLALVCPYDIGRFGGVQNQVTLLARSLRGRGHDAWVVAPGQSDQPLRSLGAARSWSVNDSSAPIKLSPLLVPKLRRAVAAADVVHVHEPLMPLVSMAARWTGRPLVGTFHADPSRVVRRLYRRFPPLRWHLRAYRSLAAVSETAHSAVAGMGDMAVIPNGVETVGLPPREPTAGRIVFVGRDDPRKGLDVAIEAIGQVRETHREAHLAVVSPDRVRAGDGVVLYWGVADDVKRELLATASVFIAPNRRGESFGLTVAEAMAAGAPCVVSDIPAFADVVADSAILVEAADPAAFAAAIRQLLDEPARALRLGDKARERAEHFSIERTTDAYLTLYEAAIR